MQTEAELEAAKARIEAESSQRELHSPQKALLQFDIRCDSLQFFLSELTNTVNEHTKKLALLEAQVRLRSSDVKIGEVLHGLADYLPEKLILNADENLRRNVTNRSLSGLGGVTGEQALHARPASAHSRDSIAARVLGGGASGEFQELATHADGFGEKMRLVGEGLAKALREGAGMRARVTDLEEQVAARLETKAAKDKFKRRKEKFHALVADRVQAAEARTAQEQALISQKLKDMEAKMQDLKEKTLWKLEDCNELLKNRVNEQFVYEVSRSVEDRLLKEWRSRHRSPEELKAEIAAQLRRDWADRQADFDARLSALHSSSLALQAKLEAGPDAAAWQRTDCELADLKAKCDSDYQQSAQIFARHEDLLKKILAEVSDDDAGTGRGAKLHALAADLAELKRRLAWAAEQGPERLENAELRVRNLEAQIRAKPSAEELHGFALKAAAPSDLAKDTAVLRAETERKLKEVEGRLRALKAGGAGLGGDDAYRKLVKMINDKASIDDVGQHILGHDMKLKNHDEVLRQMSSDLEDFAKTIRNILTALSAQGAGGEHNGILISAKGLHCLSCGRDESGKVLFNNVCGHSPYQHGGRRYKINRSVLLQPGGADDQQQLHNESHENSGSTSAYTLRKNPSQTSLKKPLRVSSARSPHLRSATQVFTARADFSKTEDEPAPPATGGPHHSKFNLTATTLPGSISSPQLLTERKTLTLDGGAGGPSFLSKSGLTEAEKNYLRETSQISARGLTLARKTSSGPDKQLLDAPVYRSDRSRSVTPSRKLRPASGRK